MEDFSGSRASHQLSQWYFRNVSLLTMYAIMMCLVIVSDILPVLVLSSWIDAVLGQMCQFLQGLYSTVTEYGELCSLLFLCLCIAT